jgi:hypothetical protein
LTHDDDLLKTTPASLRYACEVLSGLLSPGHTRGR